MKKTIKYLLSKFKYDDSNLLTQVRDLKLELNEIEWAHNYQNSIRGFPYLEKLSINVGRWAGSYAFFYVLFQILTEFRISSVLELGVGESTKFITTFNQNSPVKFKHIAIEQNEEWANRFSEKYDLNNLVEVRIFHLGTKIINGFESLIYSGLADYIDNIFDVYIIIRITTCIVYSML